MVVQRRVIVFAAALRLGDRQKGRDSLGARLALIGDGGVDVQSL